MLREQSGKESSRRYRFDFTAATSVRSKVIDLQTKYDPLDNEIRWLKRAGHLRVTRQELIIDTSRLMPMYGWFQVTLVSLVFAAAILQLAGLETAIPWKRDLTQIGLGAIWFCIAGILIKMFVNPWRTLKQAGALNPMTKSS